MTRIVKRVTPELKAKWKIFCREKGISESDMLGIVIEKITSGVITDDNKSLSEPRSNKVTIRLLAKDIDKMTSRARYEGFRNRTAWLTSLAIHTLNKEPVITESEMNALRESNRELAAIGRNLNQIAKVLNIEFRETDRLNKEAIEALANKIDQHKEIVSRLLDKNMNRWGNDE